MSPNNKQNLSKDLEDEIQNANLGQFVHQHFASSEEDEDRMITNGYTLLSQDLERANGDHADDSSSDFESDSSDEEIPAEQRNQMVRCSVNFEFQEEADEQEEQSEGQLEGDQQERGQLERGQLERGQLERDQLDADDRPANQSSRFRSYLDNHLQDVSFEREYDKREAEQQNAISLDKDNIDQIKECMKSISLPSSSIPKWAKLSDSELTSFIYKRLEQAKR